MARKSRGFVRRRKLSKKRSKFGMLTVLGAKFGLKKYKEIYPPEKVQIRGDGEGENEDFFEKFSSIRISYAASEKKRIQEFQFPTDEIDGELADQLWPTLGGWNIDDLYSEVLYALVRGRGAQSDSLICHLQQVFHIDNDKHARLLEAAREKKAPPLVLNLEVVEAKGLKGKDVNGLSDPFCTLFVSPKQKHNTSMKPETLNPVWREYFSFPVSTVEDDTLNIEVWDYDPEETLADKMKRFGEVKSTRGLRILMKEIALTASTGKQSHEFLGCLKIPLNTIPPEGIDSFFGLESRNGNGHKKKGEVHLRMALGAEKEKKVAAQEYRHVLHLLLVHELDEENVPPHEWDGKFAKHSEFILRQLELLGGLNQKDVDMARWLVYTRVQCEHPLNVKVFPVLFKTLVNYVKGGLLGDDDIRKFWFATEKLVENFATFFKNIHQCFLSNGGGVTQTYHMLQTLEMLVSHLKTRQKSNKDLEGKISVEFVIEKTENAISRGANELFSGVSQPSHNGHESPVENMIKIGQIIIADLRKGLETLHALFKELLNVDYFDITYKVYDEKYHDMVKPFVEEICSHLKPLDLREDDGFLQNQDVTMGTNLFELYLAVKQFADLSSKLTSPKDLYIQGSFHNWFHTSVAQWLDIAYFKAINRIKKAVQLDSLKPVDEFAQFTSSAVDTAHIFHQIQIFWSQLAWPEIEGSYSFIAKILDDLCRCTIYYTEMMCIKVDEMESGQDDISEELCFAINNIEWVGMEMSPISEKLGIKSIIKELQDIRGPSVAAQCERTLITVMENAKENVHNKVIEVLEKVGDKMRPMILRLLLEGSETDSESHLIETLMKYLDKNLIKLKHKLSQNNFDKIFVILWENAAVALKELINTNIEKRRPPSFFKQIHNMLQILINFFYPEGDSATRRMDATYNSSIREMEELISLYGATTGELVMKYYAERWQTQAATSNKTSELGSLTVRAHYCEDIHTLKVEILNARNLKSADANGQCDPYVKLKLVPHEVFHMTPKFRTKTKKKTLFPLFDETFSIILSPEEMSLGGMMVFSLKDHDLFGRNDFIGECFLPLESVPFTTASTSLQDLPQIFLSITKPAQPNSPILLTLENRVWDRAATDFLKHERQKFIASSTSPQQT
ncbi:protein unc-13 homolog 4B isoform X3 [Folsomia candida]|uniref:protein unc-13 homolog 4B isoform X3 n=1 Tax=Folsomia candida TaxID=158441 RepID=UPI0016054501|nr:protein unc-13 homolog 4B isoform X3 [Folsomia candida]